jgi:hypothetical protein
MVLFNNDPEINSCFLRNPGGGEDKILIKFVCNP